VNNIIKGTIILFIIKGTIVMGLRSCTLIFIIFSLLACIKQDNNHLNSIDVSIVEEIKSQEPRIICSMGLFKSTEGAAE